VSNRVATVPGKSGNMDMSEFKDCPEKSGRKGKIGEESEKSWDFSCPVKSSVFPAVVNVIMLPTSGELVTTSTVYAEKFLFVSCVLRPENLFGLIRNLFYLGSGSS